MPGGPEQKPRGSQQKPPRTKLAARRLERDATQLDMSKDTGISLKHYQRLEVGNYQQVPYAQLVNCARVLEVEVEDLIEDKFKNWNVFSADAKEPPTVPRWKGRRDSEALG